MHLFISILFSKSFIHKYKTKKNHFFFMYNIFLQNILKRTTPGSRDEDTATKAFNELKKVATDVIMIMIIIIIQESFTHHWTHKDTIVYIYYLLCYLQKSFFFLFRRS